jgi:hypothetical protein
MPYIGRDTDKISNVEVLDNITFDGSSSYTLQKGGSNFTPSSANTLLLSIDGVVQAGNFTVSGSTIDFGTAVAGTSTCDFVLHYGVGLITTPSDGSVTEAKIGTGAVTSSKLASGAVPNQSAFKNIIINGDMNIAQRGTSTASITTSGYYTVDRFNLGITTLGTWTQSQDTDVPTGQGFAKSLKMDCTTADGSPGSNDVLQINYKMEGQQLQYLKKGTSSAESTTLSFWIKATKTGTNIVELFDLDNGRQISKSYTVSSSNTWEKKTITFAGDTSGAFGNDNAASLQLDFFFGAGSNYTSGTLNTSWNSNTTANRAVGQVNHADSTSNNIYITGVQLEAGTTASDFEFLPNDINKNRCYRYFQKLSVVLMNFNTTGLLGFVFPVEMRANPSVSRSYSGNANRMYNVGTAATADVVSPTTIVSNKTIRYWYAFSPSAWAGTSRAGWETEYSIDAEL